MSLRLVPVTRREARDFVALWHRHLPRTPATWIYQVGAARGDTLVGVILVGRPIARITATREPGTVEAVRCCVADDEPNAASILYGAAWRAARALGYQRLITYTEEGESGASLRAPGYRVVGELDPRGGWDMPSRRRLPNGRENIARYIWEATA